MSNQSLAFDDGSGETLVPGTSVTLTGLMGSFKTNGAFVYVEPSGNDEFTTITLEGQLPSGAWVTAVTAPATIDNSKAGVYAVTGNFVALRVKGTGGVAFVAEVPADPGPAAPEEGSFLKAGVIF
jgi:hypothetical protein